MRSFDGFLAPEVQNNALELQIDLDWYHAQTSAAVAAVLHEVFIPDAHKTEDPFDEIIKGLKYLVEPDRGVGKPNGLDEYNTWRYTLGSIETAVSFGLDERQQLAKHIEWDENDITYEPFDVKELDVDTIRRVVLEHFDFMRALPFDEVNMPKGKEFSGSMVVTSYHKLFFANPKDENVKLYRDFVLGDLLLHFYLHVYSMRRKMWERVFLNLS